MTSSAELRNAILTAEESFMAAVSRGDAAAIASCYAEDGQVLPPNSDFVTGRQAIQSVFQSFLDMGVKEMKLETLEVDGGDDIASEVGRYTLEDAGGHVLDQGKYIVIWKYEAGQWKLYRDIFNTNSPATEH